MAAKRALKDKSVTSPLHSATLRKIIFLDRVLGHRNDRFEAEKKKFLDSHLKSQSELSEEELRALGEGFTRQYYAPEFNAMTHYEAMKEKLDELSQLENLSKTQKKQMDELSFYVDLGPQSYVASRIFDEENIKNLKKKFPSVEKQLKAEISAIAKSKYEDLSPQMASRPAVVDLFESSYPKLKSDLTLLGNNNPGLKEAAQAGMAIVRAGSAFANPSSFLLAKGVSALLKTPTFQSITRETSRSIKKMADSSGLTSKMKKIMGNWSDTSLKRVAAGVAGASVVGMVALGIMEPDSAASLYADIKTSVINFGSLTADGLSAFANSDFAEAPSAMLFDSELSMDVPNSSPDELEIESPEPKMTVEDVQNKLMSSEEPSPNEILSSLTDIKGESLSLAEVRDAMVSAASPGDVSSSLNGAVENAASSNDIVSALSSMETTIEIPQGQSYVVQPNDTLSEIIEEQLRLSGKPYDYSTINSYVEEISKSNGISDPDKIFPNQRIDLPAFPQADSVVNPSEVKNAVEASLAHSTANTDAVAKVAKTIGDPAADSLADVVNLTTDQKLDNAPDVPSNDMTPEQNTQNNKYQGVSRKL